MTTYGLPDRPAEVDYTAGVDGASQLDQYFKRTAAQPYKAPSLESYYSSRASTASARGLTTAQADYKPPGAPFRFTGNILDDFTNMVVASPLGVAGGLAQPEQRGGTVDALGLPLKTAPVNIANAATYAREAPLALITSILGQHYQKPTGGDPYAKPEGLSGNTNNIFENIGQANFPGVIDNLIDGVGVVGDAINAPFKAAADWWRNDAATSRAEQVAQLITTGHGQPSLLAMATHILDINSISDMTRIHKAAIDKGVTDTEMLADLWNLSTEVIDEIKHNPTATHDQLWKLTEGQPFSYKEFENLIGELGVTLAPMVIGAGELRGAGALAGALRGGRTLEAIGGAEKFGTIAPLISRAIGTERAAVIGERLAAIGASTASAGAKFNASSQVLGMWSLPNAWRFVRPVLKGTALVAGVSPNAYKLGAAIRIGEWMFGQAGALLGQQEMIDIADRWLFETPLSDNPGLQMADAFVVHPLRQAKAIYTAGRETTMNVIGHGEVGISRSHAQALGTIADMPLDELHDRVLTHLGWDKGTVKGFFESDHSDMSALDLKNGLYHIALQVVRDRHPESRIIPAGTIVARAVEFVRRYGDEASALLRDEASGRGHAIADAITDEFWTRSRLAEGSSVGMLGSIGPYDPHTALVQFASWIHASKFYQKAFGDEYVPALRTDVNTEFLTQYRADILGKYKPNEKLSAGDINRLVTFVPIAKDATRGIRALRPQARVPKITQATMMRFLDELEGTQRTADANRALPRTERVPSISPEDAISPDKIAPHFNLRADTVRVLMEVQRDGVEGAGPLPADLVKVLRTAYRMNADEIRRDPAKAWTRAVDWFANQYSSAVTRGQAVDITERFGRRLATVVPSGDLPAVNAALERVAHGFRHPYAAHDPSGAPVPANIVALMENRSNLASEFVGRVDAWLNDPRSRMVARDTGDGPVLETKDFTAPMGDHLRILADKVLLADAHATDPALSAVDRAMLADPNTHIVELNGILQRATQGLDASDEAFVRNRPGDFETAYGDQFAEVADPAADPTPITRAMVDKLTKEVVASAAERDALVASAKDIASVVDHNPRATMLPDLADWLDRAGVLGTTRIGAERGPKSEIARWRGLAVDVAAVDAVSNEAALTQARVHLETRVSNLRDDVISAERAREIASDRLNAPLGADDFTWAETPDKTFTRKADAQSHATLMADAGVPQRVAAVVGPRGGKQWGVFRGELKARPEGLTPAEVTALQTEVAAARAAGDASFAAAQAAEAAKPAVEFARFGTDARGNATVPEMFKSEEGYVYRTVADTRIGSDWRAGEYAAKHPATIYVTDPSSSVVVRTREAAGFDPATGGVNASDNVRSRGVIPASEVEVLAADGTWHPVGGTPTEAAPPPAQPEAPPAAPPAPPGQRPSRFGLKGPELAAEAAVRAEANSRPIGSSVDESKPFAEAIVRNWTDPGPNREAAYARKDRDIYRVYQERAAQAWDAEYRAGSRPAYVVDLMGGNIGGYINRVVAWYDDGTALIQDVSRSTGWGGDLVPREQVIPASAAFIEAERAVRSAYAAEGHFTTKEKGALTAVAKGIDAPFLGGDVPRPAPIHFTTGAEATAAGHKFDAMPEGTFLAAGGDTGLSYAQEHWIKNGWLAENIGYQHEDILARMGAEGARPAAAPVIVEKLAEPERILQAQEDTYAVQEAARQAAFDAHAQAYPESVHVPFEAPVEAPAVGSAVGDLVKFKMSAVVKGKPGTMNSAGTVTKLLPDGGVEVRLQAGGYHTLARGEFEAHRTRHPERGMTGPVELASPVDLYGLMSKEQQAIPVWEKPAYMTELTRSITAEGMKEPIRLGYDPTTKRVIVYDGNHRVHVALQTSGADVPVRVFNLDTGAPMSLGEVGLKSGGKVETAAAPATGPDWLSKMTDGDLQGELNQLGPKPKNVEARSEWQADTDRVKAEIARRAATATRPTAGPLSATEIGKFQTLIAKSANAAADEAIRMRAGVQAKALRAAENKWKLAQESGTADMKKVAQAALDKAKTTYDSFYRPDEAMVWQQKAEVLQGISHGIETGRWSAELIAAVARKSNAELLALVDRVIADNPNGVNIGNSSRWFNDHFDELTGHAPGAVAPAAAPAAPPRPAPVEVTFLDPMDNKTPIRSHVVIVDAANVLTSADEAYPSVFQPRSRGLRVESDRQIAAIAKDLQPSKLFGMTEGDAGTPILSPDGFVISGNGRTQGIRLASEPVYRTYKEALRAEAVKYGFDPAILDTMDRPVLFRQLEGVDPVAMKRLAWQLNGKGFPIGDLAVAFADEVKAGDLDKLKIAEKQDLRDALTADKNTAVVDAIIAKMPPDWRNTYIGPDGRPSEAGTKLVEGAIFAKLLRADVPGPHQDAARDLVVASIEQGGEEMRRVFNGVYGAAAAMLKAQARADAGTNGIQYLATVDTLSQALTEILRRRRADTTMGQIAVDLQTIDAFAEFTVPAQVGHLGALLASSTQSEIGAFLRGVANATEQNASVGMFEEAAPVTTTGLLNSGMRAWNAERSKAGKTEFDNFPSGDAPHDTAITVSRDLPDGNVAPPVLMSVPLQPGELAGEVNARTLGQPVRVEGETLRDARGATESPGSITARDPGERAFLEAYRADPEGVRADVTDAFDAASRFTDPIARHDYLKALIASANDGTIEPGDWAVLREIIYPVRRNTKGRINNVTRAQLAQTAWAARMVHGLRESLDDLDAVTRLGEGDPSQTRLIRQSAQKALTEAELHAVTGPDVPHVPADPIAADLATTSEHTITTNDNPTVEAAVRKATGAPAVAAKGQRAYEFNAPNGVAQVERLAAIAQARRAALAAEEQRLKDFQTNPPLPATSPRGSVFSDPNTRGLWDRLMLSGVDPIASAVGSAEPRSLAEVIDAIQSIDRGSLTDPVTGVGITPEEAPLLRADLMRIAEGTLTTATGRVKDSKAKARNARVRVPDDFDAEGMADAMDKLTSEVAPLISSDPSIPKLDGFAGTQYFPSPPTGATGEAGTITPRLPFRDWIGSDLVPGLKEELESRRMMEPGERIRRSRALSAIEHLIGPRSQRAMTANAVQIFHDQIERVIGAGEALDSAQADQLKKAVDQTIQAWRDHIERATIAPLPFSIYRRIDLMGPKEMNRIMGEEFAKAFPDGFKALGGVTVGGKPVLRGFDASPIWRQADNRIRQFLLDQHQPLSTAIEHYYGKVADGKLGTAGRWLNVVYHITRFTAEVRWLSLEVTEPVALGLFHGGLQVVADAMSAKRAAAAGSPLGFGGMARRNYFQEYAHWTRAGDIEQVTPLRQRVIMRMLQQRQQRPFREAMMEALAKDPQLTRIMTDLGDTPNQFLHRLDRDYQLLEQGAHHFTTEGEAASFFKPWLDSGVIDEAKYAEYVHNKVYSSDPRIEAELRKTNDPVAHVLYSRLAQINHDLMHDLTGIFFGQENRSNLQRVLNHPFLYWPISYQIKATKWLARFMGEEAFGIDAGMLPAVALQRVYERHKELMATSPQYRKDLSDNATLYFLASMFLPIAPWDIGVSLSPWTRQALSIAGLGPDYQRPFGAFGFGQFSTYGMAARLIHEKFGADLPFLEQIAPVVISTRSKPTSRVEQAAQQAAGPADIPYVVPEVPRLP